MVTDRDYELLSEYLDDALNASEHAALEARLTADAELRRELDALRETVVLVKSLSMRQAPRNFTLDASMIRHPNSQRLWFSPVFYSAVSTIAAVFLLGFGLLLLMQNNSAAPAALEQQAAGIALRASPTTLLKDTDGSLIVGTTTEAPIAPPQPLDAVEETQRETGSVGGEASTNNDVLQNAQLGQAQTEAQVNNSPQPQAPSSAAAGAQAYAPSDTNTSSAEPPPALSFAAPAQGTTVEGYSNTQAAGQEFSVQNDQSAAVAAAPTLLSTSTETMTHTPTATLTETPVPPTPTLTSVPVEVVQALSSDTIALLSIGLGILLLVAAVYFFLRSRRRS